ncbi:NtaA/DmoA family FMN-dependent monooxygenase [Amycolatopsis pithecellobii]|nr:NtaA/DmoA family FMN-dependent monooxygenase [Amycolatopsis pithecellobii]
MPDSPQMCLNLFLSVAGYHAGAWRRPDSRVEELTTLGRTAEIVRQAEDAKLDAVFIADLLGWHDNDFGKHPRMHPLEPITTLAALAGLTERIGLIGTVSTSYTEPYNLARYFASLDHLSGGRAGWNIVTSYGGGEQFGRDREPHDERYARATEYLEVVCALWDSWDADAVVNDRAGGTWARADRIHRIDHAGPYYQVAGPLNIPRSPQGRPVFAQAGSSEAGMAFGSTFGDVIFTAQPDLASARRFRETFRGRVRVRGRDPGSVKVLPGLMPIIGPSERAARELADEIADAIDYPSAVRALEWVLGDLGLADRDPDGPLPVELLKPPEEFDGGRTRYEILYRLAVHERYTIRELLRYRARAAGHHPVIGTAGQVAEEMIEWFDGGAADGFNLLVPHLPGGLDAITGELVPILRERGYFRAEYAGTTLREHLGLDVPGPAGRDDAGRPDRASSRSTFVKGI